MTADTLQASLRHAMLSERDGYQFYAMAAEQATDRDAALMFEHLADEEKAHFEALQSKYQALLEMGTWEADTAWNEPWTPRNVGRIFSDDFVRRIRGKHLEVAALSIGILLEKQAFEFYTQQAKAAVDAPVRAFFGELAAWEDGHYQMLLREDEALKEQYWRENRFEPLL